MEGLDMAAYASGAEGGGELSAHEKKVLAAIEEDLRTADPTLACHLARIGGRRPATRWRAAFRHGALLIAALIILIIAALMMPPGWWAGLGLLTSLLLVPWILLFPTDHPHQD